MAYENFKPTVWSKYILKELEKKCVLAKDCWKQFEGEAKKGKAVKILGAGRPTISDYTGEDISIETIADQSTMLSIDQAKYFGFEVDDVDKAQASEGLMEALMDEATTAMSIAQDSFIASLAADSAYKSAVTQVNSKDKAKEVLDAAILQLRENDVAISDKVVIEIPPFVHAYVRDLLVTEKTDNDQLIKTGSIGMYDGCTVKLSNNLYHKTESSHDTFYCMVRTPKAIAFAQGVEEVEAFRPQLRFSDAIKGLSCYGGKVIRPKELYVIRAYK